MLLIPRLDDKSPIPQYLQLVDYIKREIASGRLADYLSLSPTPVELAYNQLAAEGFIASVPRKGYYVQYLPEPYLQTRDRGRGAAAVFGSGRRDEAGGARP
ncbi:hypothetical protein [Paenibacillus thiaminolyticus]|uniref:hypothetical protein n=1 Tax=Paenibacillus thiaminolyticus TaxID=49283 RepID=UPI00267C3752|nr:hypothetical protein [Paenibacillus thiaminolyticus]